MRLLDRPRPEGKNADAGDAWFTAAVVTIMNYDGAVPAAELHKLSTWPMTRVEPTYFPPLTFGVEVEQDDFIQQWFGKHLRSMDEPRLHLQQTCDVVRLLTLPTFHEPRLVRIDRRTTATRITAKQTNGRRGYGPGRLTVDRTIDVPLSMFDDAINLLNSTDFWQRRTLDDAVVMDGTRYVIESKIADKYHVIERASPDHRERELLDWINSHAQSLFPKRWITTR